MTLLCASSVLFVHEMTLLCADSTAGSPETLLCANSMPDMHSGVAGRDAAHPLLHPFHCWI